MRASPRASMQSFIRGSLGLLSELVGHLSSQLLYGRAYNSFSRSFCKSFYRNIDERQHVQAPHSFHCPRSLSAKTCLISIGCIK